jgi:hypothetical protein
MLARRETVAASLLPAAAAAALPQFPAAEVRRGAWLRAAPMNGPSADRLTLTPPLGADLLRQTLARFSAPAEPPVPLPADRLAPANGEGASSAGASTSAAAGDSPPLPAAPAIQNTFNVTVHMADAALANEEELAERLTRVLIEQARRNGIDI